MADIDAVLRPSARAFFDEVARGTERREILDRVEAICRLPDIDDVTIFPFGRSGQRIFNDSRYWLTFRMLNAWTIEVEYRYG